MGMTRSRLNALGSIHKLRKYLFRKGKIETFYIVSSVAFKLLILQKLEFII